MYVSARCTDEGNIDRGTGGRVDHENLSSQEWTLVIHTNFTFSGRKDPNSFSRAEFKLIPLYLLTVLAYALHMRSIQ